LIFLFFPFYVRKGFYAELIMPLCLIMPLLKKCMKKFYSVCFSEIITLSFNLIAFAYNKKQKYLDNKIYPTKEKLILYVRQS